MYFRDGRMGSRAVQERAHPQGKAVSIGWEMSVKTRSSDFK